MPPRLRPTTLPTSETRNEDMAACAWPRSATVPALFYNGANNRGVAIIDDVLLRIKRSEGGTDVAKQLVAELTKRTRARGGKPVKLTLNPKLWNGRKLERSSDWLTITQSMPEYLATATLKWLPDYVSEGKLPPGVVTGTALQRQLDSLVLEQGTGPLTREQKDFQSLTGTIRYPVQVLYRSLHAGPPPTIRNKSFRPPTS